MDGKMFEVIRYVEGICKDVLGELDPKPFIAVGGSSVEQPFMCHVGELPQGVQVLDPSSSATTLVGGAPTACGLYRIEFDVALTMWGDRHDLAATSQTILGWWELVARAVAADRTLGGLVQHAQPFYSTGWTGRNQKRTTYIVAIEGGVRVRMDINPLLKEEDDAY